jgi:hypothetical protein
MVAYVSIRTILAGKSLHTTGSSQPAPSTLDQIDHFHFHFPVATNKKSPTAKLMPLSRSRFTCFCKMEDSWDGGTLHPSCHPPLLCMVVRGNKTLQTPPTSIDERVE